MAKTHQCPNCGKVTVHRQAGNELKCNVCSPRQYTKSELRFQLALRVLFWGIAALLILTYVLWAS